MTWITKLAEVIAAQCREHGPGSVVVVDFLSRDECAALLPRLKRSLGKEWGVHLVGDPAKTAGALGADQAVDLREDLSRRTCFLVLPEEAGAGLQGVFDVAHRIDERDSLLRVRAALQRELREQSRELEAYTREACRTIQTTGAHWKRTDLFLRREVEYLEAVCSAPSLATAGRELHRLGLVPDGDPKSERLAENAKVLQDLLRTEKNRIATAAERVGRLKLTDSSIRKGLIAYLRDKPLQSLDQWLPGLRDQGLTFDRWTRESHLTEITGIELIPLRQPNRKPYKWTGLNQDEGGDLYFSLHKESQIDQFEIRWKSVPAALLKGAVEYRISLVPVPDGEPVLEDFVAHKAVKTGQQKWQIDRERLAELGEELTVFVRLSVIGREDEGEGAIQPEETEQFLLTAATVPEGAASGSAARQTRSLWDARLELALADRDSDPWYAIAKPKANCVELHLGTQTRKLLLPEVLAKLEERLLQRDVFDSAYEATVQADGSASQPEAAVLTALTADRWAGFARARRSLFSKLQKAAQALSTEEVKHPLVVEALDLTQHQEAIWDLARNYATALKDAAAGCASEDETVRAEAREALAAGLRVDSLLLRRPDGAPLGWLVAPTHPLRLLWLLGYGALLEHWRGELLSKPKAARRALFKPENLDGLVPHLFPAFAALASGALWSYADGVGLFWGLLLPTDCPDPQQAAADVLRALGLNVEVTTTAALTAGCVGDKIAEYLGLHPYVKALQLNA
ncbi:MAG: hypothetical protein COS65_18005, partial [Armatimonadetes bacterium CG06_land_8_20_14_3_00_66_21]